MSGCTTNGAAGPILKWAGGKGALLPQYEPYFPALASRFFEPFTGSAAVFFHLRNRGFAAEYHLSDVNPELINLYQAVRDDLPALIDILRLHRDSHSRDYFYTVRRMDRAGLDRFTPLERAARMIYLNRTCFNGLWRVNSRGEFNVPMGRYDNPTILDEDRLHRASEALSAAHLSLRTFDDAVEDARAGDFIYFDPPYVPLSPTSNFTSYALNNFGEADQRMLAHVFADLHARGCKVMLSNSDTSLVRALYADFRIISIQASRRINSNAARRGDVAEVLVLSYA